MRSTYKYPDGSVYDGEWNKDGQRHGKGVMTYPDGTKYKGAFSNGLCSGLGIMTFTDDSNFSGEFENGKFNGHGVFVRADGMRYQGKFRDGKIWGHGLLTFADGTNGLPRNEGYFEGSQVVRREKCAQAIYTANKASEDARSLH